MKAKTQIYNYESVNTYLQDFIKANSAESSAFSFRSLTTRLTGISHSQLFQVVKGKKRFPSSLVNELSTKVLKLNRQEKRYFKSLVEINHLVFDKANKTDIEEVKQSLNNLKPLNIVRVEFNEITARPLTVIIFEMVNRRDIHHVKDIVPSLFHFEVTSKKIQESLNYLKETGHIQIAEDGSLKKCTDHLISDNDTPNKFLRAYHKEVSSYASQIIDEIKVDLREFQAYAINIDQADIPLAKDLIRTFMQEFARQIEASPKKANSTYNLNVQFFPLTKD
jgi:uncharacterized protein (TIGR02147 family)